MKQYSLSEFSEILEEALQQCDEIYWVKAEIASLSERGHGYFELVENAENGLPAAKIRATCWKETYTMISAFFEQETGQHLRAGISVLVAVEVQYHPVYGLSVNILDIDPTFTIGDMARQKQMTLKRLQEEGVIGMQKALVFPELPHRIAVVSAKDAAGYDDFVDQIMHNRYHYPWKLQLFPATLQGEHAAHTLINALDTIAQQAEQWDAVVIIRGGGAVTDLGCYDDYNLACLCAQFPLPILTGIGHTRDVSVVDQVVYAALKTPTAAAEWLLSLVEVQINRIETLSQRLRMSWQRLILSERNRLSIIEKTIALHSPERIFRMGYSLTTINGKPIRSTTQVQAGDKIRTMLHNGELTSIVQ